MKNLNQQSEIMNRFNVTELEDRFEMKRWRPVEFEVVHVPCDC